MAKAPPPTSSTSSNIPISAAEIAKKAATKSESLSKSAKDSKTVTKKDLAKGTNQTAPSASATSNWIEAKTDDGKTYFYHTVTRVVRWERPEGDVAEKIEASIEETEREARRRQEQRLKEMHDEEQAKIANSSKVSKATDDGTLFYVTSLILFEKF